MKDEKEVRGEGGKTTTRYKSYVCAFNYYAGNYNIMLCISKMNICETVIYHIYHSHFIICHNHITFQLEEPHTSTTAPIIQ